MLTLHKYTRYVALMIMIMFVTACGTDTKSCKSCKPFPDKEYTDRATMKGTKGLAGNGKHVVFIAGDEEYRSEEMIPMIAQIMAKHHGFNCTVLFSQNNEGHIDPHALNNIPGLEALKTADLMFIFTRFRDLPDEQMKHIDDYLMSGKPVIGIRTSTHAFKINPGKTYSHYHHNFTSKDGKHKEWAGGFGQFILGEKWISHHGVHRKEATRGLIAKGAEKHPVVRGIQDGDIWGNSDVYGVRLDRFKKEGYKNIVMGQVLKGMKFDSKPITEEKRQRRGKEYIYKPNTPMMPIVWEKDYQLPGGKKGKVLTSTIGASTDVAVPGSRRLLVNAVYYMTGVGVPAKAKVDTVNEYKPTFYNFKEGRKVKDKKLKPTIYNIR